MIHKPNSTYRMIDVEIYRADIQSKRGWTCYNRSLSDVYNKSAAGIEIVAFKGKAETDRGCHNLLTDLTHQPKQQKHQIIRSTKPHRAPCIHAQQTQAADPTASSQSWN